MPFEVYAAGKCHHPVVYFSAMVAREELIALLSAHERPSMKHKRLRVQSKTVDASIEIPYSAGYIHALIMEDHANYVKARIAVRIQKASRLIYKYAQCLFRFHAAVP